MQMVRALHHGSASQPARLCSGRPMHQLKHACMQGHVLDVLSIVFVRVHLRNSHRHSWAADKRFPVGSADVVSKLGCDALSHSRLGRKGFEAGTDLIWPLTQREFCVRIA